MHDRRRVWIAETSHETIIRKLRALRQRAARLQDTEGLRTLWRITRAG